MFDRIMTVDYFPNYIELMARFSTAEMVAKPKHPVNICDDSANRTNKAETKLIHKVFKMFFLEKSLHSLCEWT